MMMKEENVLFNNEFNTFLCTVIWCRIYNENDVQDTGHTLPQFYALEHYDFNFFFQSFFLFLSYLFIYIN